MEQSIDHSDQSLPPMPDQPATNHNAWISPRRKRFWLIISVGLYSLLGFFVVPAVLQNQIVSQVDQQLNRSASVEKISFNPYALSLNIHGFNLADRDGASLASFDEFAVNFQLSSLFRWAWTFAEIRLESPRVFYERFADGDSRLDQLLAELETTDTALDNTADDSSETTGLPRLLVHSLVLNRGQATIIDRQPAKSVDIALGPIDIAVEQLSTLPDQSGQQKVAVQLPGGGELSWQGSIDISPFASTGELKLDNLQLQTLTPYLASQLAIEEFTAALSSNMSYQIGFNTDGQFTATLDPLDIQLNGTTLTGLTPSTEFVSIPAISLEGGSLRIPQQQITIQRLEIDQPIFKVWRDSDGSLSLTKLLLATGAPAPGAPATAADEPGTRLVREETTVAGPTPPEWQVSVNEFSVDQARIGFIDRSTKPTANVGLADLNIRATAISTTQGAQFPFSISTSIQSNQSAAGSLALDGELGLLPAPRLRASLATTGVELATAQPWTNEFVAITIGGGELNSQLSAELIPDQGMTITGSIELPELDLKESRQQIPVGGWAQLAINDISLGLTPDWQPQTVAIGEVTLQQPFARIAIDKQGNNNLAALILPANGNSAIAPTDTDMTNSTTPPTIAINIGGISVDNGSLDFSDLSLPLPFATVVDQLDGSVTAFSNARNEPTSLMLEGQVNQYGLARIAGSIALFEPTHNTDISMEFLNLEMARVSPYSAEFAGRKIDQGKLDLNLNYAITEGNLSASNDILLRDLELGDKIDSPNATSLPLGIALALLKDGNGVIDIKLPITGNINDPQFKVGPVIWKAFAGLIGKVATSPFRLLGNLIGIDSDELGQFQFRAGVATLTPPELEKVTQLQQALKQRPNLVVQISGRANANLDRPALTLASLQTMLLTQTGKEDVDLLLLLDRERKPLEKLFKKTFPDIKLRAVRKTNKFPPVDNPDGKAVFNESAYITDLRRQLLASITISDRQLILLAQQRALILKEQFIAEGLLAENRVLIIDPELENSAENKLVMMELTITH